MVKTTGPLLWNLNQGSGFRAQAAMMENPGQNNLENDIGGRLYRNFRDLEWYRMCQNFGELWRVLQRAEIWIRWSGFL